MQEYSVIVIDGEQITVPFRMGQLIKAILQDDRGIKLLQIGLDWVRMTANGKGSSVVVNWSGGTGKPAA